MAWLRDIPDHRDFHVTPRKFRKSDSNPKRSSKSRRLFRSRLICGRGVHPSKTRVTWARARPMRRRHPRILPAAGLRQTPRRLPPVSLQGERNLLGIRGDQGAELRDTMKAMVLFGVPPETYWPYEIEIFDEEPQAFCYAFAQSYKTTRYYRLTPPARRLPRPWKR